MKKVLDKPAKVCYNIRKDVTVALCPVYESVLDVIDNWDSDSGIPKPVLAGGAIRDLNFRLPPKDFDLFIRCDNLEHAYEIADRLNLLYDLSTKELNDAYEKNMEDIYFVFDEPTKQIQFILKEWAGCVTDDFDLDIYKAYYDSETGNAVFTPEFVQAKQNRQPHPTVPKDVYSYKRYGDINRKLFKEGFSKEALCRRNMVLNWQPQEMRILKNNER